LRNFLKKITHPFLKLGLKIYYFKPRTFCYDEICVKVHPDVFPPHLTLSTKILLDFISEKELTNKTFLELGCGCGIISLFAAKKRAKVTATDINLTALEFLKENTAKSDLHIEILFSDLFESLKNRCFDYIIINPPYYPKTPKNIKEKAWFCGEHFEYFEDLFLQLNSYISIKNNVFMILSEDCELQKIKAIAFKKSIAFSLIEEKKIVGEKNYIFKLTSS
jgi:release factor glutamine methyltransferase